MQTSNSVLVLGTFKRLEQGNAGSSGCVLGFCQQIPEQSLQNITGDVGDEEGTKRMPVARGCDGCWAQPCCCMSGSWKR